MEHKNEEKQFTPRDLKPGEKGRVIRVGGEANVRKRLLDMGIVPGVEIKLQKIAPLGDPLDVLVKGYHLSLREEEAKNILVEKLEEP
jgi:Fe2+ transport system protein FeoA